MGLSFFNARRRLKPRTAEQPPAAAAPRALLAAKAAEQPAPRPQQRKAAKPLSKKPVRKKEITHA